MPALRRALGFAFAGALLLAAVAAPGVEARGGPGASSSPVGNDIGWPQCGGAYPKGQAFGIVGLNDGLANNLNPCLASELAWAAGSSGKSASLPPAAIYVNTADPGQVINLITDWPTGNTGSVTDPYGSCDGTDSAACSWQYGWDRATQDVQWLAATVGTGFSTLAAAYPWWLDVETGNTWETGGSAALANNTADLEGMVAALEYAGAPYVGVYSTSYQWSTIAGATSGQSALNGLPDWIPGARTQSAAQSNCSLPSFTGGPVLITQWFGKYDGDVSCLG